MLDSALWNPALQNDVQGNRFRVKFMPKNTTPAHWKGSSVANERNIQDRSALMARSCQSIRLLNHLKAFKDARGSGIYGVARLRRRDTARARRKKSHG